MPLAYGLLSEQHIRTDIVTSRLPKQVRAILEVFTDAIAILIVAYLVWRSIGLVSRGIENNLHSGTGINVLLWPLYLVIVIGLTLFTLALIVKLRYGVKQLIQANKKRKLGKN